MSSETIIPEPSPKGKPRFAGLYLLPYVLEALRSGAITPRQAILLAHVDKSPDETWTVEYLRRILQCTTRTVNLTITGLTEKRPRLLRATKVDRWRWRLAPRQRDPDDDPEGSALFVSAEMRDNFESGKLTPIEMLVIAKIWGFARGNRPCFAGNAWLGGFFGLSAERTRGVIRSLERNGWLRREFIPSQQLRCALANGYTQFKGRDGCWSRLLVYLEAKEDDDGDGDP